MLCPDGFDGIVWKMAENMAIENKSHAETFILEVNWETTYSEMIRNEIHHNLVSSTEELTREWYQFAIMMIHHKDPYWAGLYSLTKL
jgi:hypothetical protein